MMSEIFSRDYVRQIFNIDLRNIKEGAEENSEKISHADAIKAATEMQKVYVYNEMANAMYEINKTFIEINKTLKTIENTYGEAHDV